MFRRCLILLVVAVVATSLVACGKKGTPQPPGESDFPRTYPNLSKYPPVHAPANVPLGTSTRSPSPESTTAPSADDNNEDDLGFNPGRMTR